ncbi:TPA: tRNA uridine(34) 5-carboxymethylaminomethyl modification radical SAM/GNAT enzyme Elp3 [Candidatus Gracilibacteria bacterium]|nr:tRNA uridine(34) 5-carboxymethylaminomethyl modification radical SAM/GNAT enzyme Elp3 [Candidatus Gracilibacteria bacterium]HIQ57142.1 tRNA uridine(34) 5-carboxymethylaminomethyl modification radical SAM/GNAT enzyme Elp3 [Candidatus Gracilibacteria bacterium]
MSHEKKQVNFKKHQILEYEKESLLFLEDLLADIPKNIKKLEARKNHFAQAHNIPTLKNRELIVAAQKNNINLPDKLMAVIQKRVVRTISGVSPIGMLTKPFECPGKCTYCPTEDRMPKSYMKNQPAAARALRNNFDPFDQVKNRIIALTESGHPASKIEIIVMGGTWSFLPKTYQNWYIKNIYEAANSFDEETNIIEGGDGFIDPIRNKKNPALFVDFDGVIADSYDFVFGNSIQLFQEAGIDMTVEGVKSIFTQHDVWNFEGADVVKEKLSQLEEEKYSDEVSLFSDIVPLMQTLSQYFDLIIVSANQKIVIDKFLKKHFISGLFKQVIGRDAEIAKSESMKNILEIYKQEARETFFIGDTISDMKEGKLAGVKTLAAGWGKIFSAEEFEEYNTKENLEIFRICTTIKDLEKLLDLDETHLKAGKKEGDILLKTSGEFSKKIISLEEIEKKSEKKSLHALQKINETVSHRIIGLTLETRPDFITEDELIRMRNYGCTRIEVGVQTLDDDIQKLTKRGHGRKEVIRAMKRMKNFGFKVCFHLMPGLPGSTPEKDLEMMKEVFLNQDFRPDFIKIYPCMVLPTSELEGIWNAGNFTPMHDKELVKLLVQFQLYVPEWTRIMRLMRDIPATNILDGAKFSNLRQILQEQPKKLLEIVGEEFYNANNLAEKSKNLFKDIRSREVGFSDKKPEKPVLKRRNYDASDGQEVFLSFESDDKSQLFALLRLRNPEENVGEKVEEIKNKEFRDVLKNSALIREVHSYGSEISVGEGQGSEEVGQHRGLGRKLIEESEKIAREEWKKEKMVIIAGIGTREYYRKWGYEEVCGYMVKIL